MIDLALLEPEIPPNTGNIIRLCANTGSRLALIGELGFSLEDKHLRRAGLDYHDLARVQRFESLQACCKAWQTQRVFALTTRGERSFYEPRFAPGDLLLFGPETRGLPQSLLKELGREHCLRLPMRDGARSLNLSNAVSVCAYEAWRQLGFSNS